MATMLLVLTALLLQDDDARYREALYLEVDRGELDKAIELYAKVEADAKAPESVRARSAFRRASCLEKKGDKVEAERAYREVTTRYAGQAETARKAKERLERLVSGNGGAAAPSMEDRIAGLVLDLGQGASERGLAAHRSLVLIGEPAVPALRRALTHRDVTLSARAACVLVEMEQDSGTYDVLMRGLLENVTGCSASVAALVRRQEGLRKDFAAAFRSVPIEDASGARLRCYLGVLQLVQVPELRDHLKRLVVEGPQDIAGEVARALQGIPEPELLELLAKVEKASAPHVRAVDLLEESGVDFSRMAEPSAFAARLVAVFGDGTVPLKLKVNFSAIDYARDLRVLAECTPVWLTKGKVGGVVNIPRAVAHGIVGHGREGVLVGCRLLESKPELAQTRLLDILCALVGPVDPDSRDQRWRAAADVVAGDREVRAALARALWAVADRARPDGKAAALNAVFELADKGEVPLERLIPSAIALNVRQWKGEGAEADIDAWFAKSGEDVRGKILQIVKQAMGARDEETQEYAVHLTGRIGDETRLDPLLKLATDESRSVALRCTAISAMVGLRDAGAVRSALAGLIGDRNVQVRACALNVLTGWRKRESEPQGGYPGRETDALVAPLVADADPDVRWIVVTYLSHGPCGERIEPLSKALAVPEAGLRLKAVAALGYTGSMKAVPHLIRMLEDADGNVRSCALTHLAAIRKHYDEIEQWKKWYEAVKEKK